MSSSDINKIYNKVITLISSPKFKNPIRNFIDQNCSSFLEVEENTFEQGALYNEFVALVDNHLSDSLKNNNITEEMFLLSAKKGLENSNDKKYFEELISYSNYIYFKSLMVKRNYEIIKQVENEMKRKGEAKYLANEKERKQREDKELQAAIQLSMAAEEEKRKIAAIEEAELKVKFLTIFFFIIESNKT